MPDPLNLLDRTVPAMNALAATMSGKDAQHAFAAFTAELAKTRTPFYAAPDGEDGFVVAVPMERRQALVDTLGLAAQARFEASRDGSKRFEQISESQGWTESTQLELVRDFVESLGLSGLLACYVGDRAAET